MTDGAVIARRGRGSPLRGIGVVALCVFMVAWLFLAWQLRTGRDPALGTGGATPVVKHISSQAKHHQTPVLVTRTSGGGG
jgi:hypothetical protein